MPVISSRGASSQVQISALQQALKENLPLVFEEKELSADLDDLITDAILTMETLRMIADELDADCEDHEKKISYLENELDKAQDMLANILGDVGYDEALDDAAGDLIDCLISSGAAEPTASGEIGFDPRVTFSKEDIKPMLREAVVKWIEKRLQG